MSKKIISSIAEILTHLPKKIINNRHHDALTDCILYEISQEMCLHFEEVSYFIYNPDFHLCKGIAGIKKNEIHEWCNNNDLWNNINEFENIIKKTNYNQSIKKMQFCTLFSEKEINKIIKEIQKIIDIHSASSYHWQIQNNNIGILLYQSTIKENNTIEKEYIENAASLLGFCPIC
jgi:hypothetical protein